MWGNLGTDTTTSDEVQALFRERIDDRDTERVLNNYKRAAKNSMHDGDVLL
jgi:hypothetical protein